MWLRYSCDNFETPEKFNKEHYTGNFALLNSKFWVDLFTLYFNYFEKKTLYYLTVEWQGSIYFLKLRLLNICNFVFYFYKESKKILYEYLA